MRLGAEGIMSKQSKCPQITAGIKTVLAGNKRNEVILESSFPLQFLQLSHPEKHMTMLSLAISGYI